MWMVVLLQLMLASSFIVSKALLGYMPPFLLAGMRMTLGGMCLIFFLLLFDRHSLRVTRANIIPLICAALFGIYFTNTLEAWGLRETIAAKAYFIYNMSPFFAALLGYWLFNERMTHKKWLGLGIGFLGFFPLIYQDLFASNFFRAALPEVALLSAAMATVVGWVAKKKLIYYQHFSIVLANGLTMTAGGLGALVTAELAEEFSWYAIFSQPAVWVLMWLNIILTCFVGYNLYAYLLKRYSATFTTFSGLFGSLLSALLGWLFLGESVSIAFYISFVMVAIGLFIFHQEEIKQQLLEESA